MTDYEVRDINDQINKLLREKHHWENQIIALGGANYKRAAGKSTDADGREVPGQRGYKCVGFFPAFRPHPLPLLQVEHARSYDA